MAWSLLAAVALLFAQDMPLTNLQITGDRNLSLTSSDTNACYVSDNALNAQLTDPASGLLISMVVLATVGPHPALNQLTALSLDGPSDDPFVNWSSTGGTVTLDDVAAQVPVESGESLGVQASTHGVLGHIEADLSSKQGAFHISGPFACHSP